NFSLAHSILLKFFRPPVRKHAAHRKGLDRNSIALVPAEHANEAAVGAKAHEEADVALGGVTAAGHHDDGAELGLIEFNAPLLPRPGPGRAGAWDTGLLHDPTREA